MSHAAEKFKNSLFAEVKNGTWLGGLVLHRCDKLRTQYSSQVLEIQHLKASVLAVPEITAVTSVIF